MKKRKSKSAVHSGSSLDSFLAEEGILEEVEAVAISRVTEWQVAQAMKDGNLSRKMLLD